MQKGASKVAHYSFKVVNEPKSKQCGREVCLKASGVLHLSNGEQMDSFVKKKNHNLYSITEICMTFLFYQDGVVRGRMTFGLAQIGYYLPKWKA